MFNEPGRGAPGPRQCSSCGARLDGPMKFCPQCGANLLVRPLRMAAASGPAQHAWPYLYIFGCVAAFALVVGAYVLSHRGERDQITGVQIIQGSVAEPEAASAAPVNRQAAAHPAPPAVANVPPQQMQPAPATTAEMDAERHSVALEKSLPADRASALKGDARTRDLARSLASARASLDKNSLWPARRAITNALAEQPGNSDALQMQGELKSREQQRDSLLGYARLCAREAKWVCVWQNAGHALTVDASSNEARRLLSRAIAEHAAQPSKQFDPSLPESTSDD
jgi:type IV secretory pathway VirB10-like protein